MSSAATHPFRVSTGARVGFLLLAVYAFYAASQLDFTWDRFITGLDNGARFLGRMFPPNFSNWELLIKGLSESLQIAVLASLGGILISLPVSLMASRNLIDRKSVV